MKKLLQLVILSFSLSLAGSNTSKAAPNSTLGITQTVGQQLSVALYPLSVVASALNPFNVIPTKKTMLVQKGRAYRIVVSRSKWEMKRNCNDNHPRPLKLRLLDNSIENNRVRIQASLETSSNIRTKKFCGIGDHPKLKKQTSQSSMLWIAPKNAYIKFQIPAVYELQVLPL